MKALGYLLILLTWIECITACNQKTNGSDSNVAKLAPSQTLSLPLDKQTPNWASDCQYYDDKRGSQIILYYSPVTQCLYQYDVNKRRLISTIKFQSQGPVAIPEPMAVQMLATDSILVATSYTKQLFLVNGKGVILNKYNIVADSNLAQQWRSEPSAKFYVHKGVCIFETAPLANPKDAKTYYTTPLGVSLNLRTNQSKVNYLEYPKEYKTGNYWTLFHNMQRMTVNNKGRVVVSYPISDHIEEIDADGHNKIEHSAESSYFESQTQPMKGGIDGRVHFLRQNSYGAIYYDPYRDVYYRFASQAIKDDLPKRAGPIIPATFMPTSVIILDNKFNKIGETLLPEKKHYYYNSFVGKDGFYISNSHPENITNKEDQVSFTCYKLAR